MQQTQATKAPLKKIVPIKTYRLLDYTKPTAPIYVQVSNNERVRITERARYRAFIQQTFTTEDQINRTARLKLNSNTIWLDEQITQGIPANAKFTKSERDAVLFVNGRLMTNLAIVQEYLEATPQFEGFKGIAHDGTKPLYKLEDKQQVASQANSETRTRVKAANIILGLELKDAQDLLILINGSLHVPPNEVTDCQNDLMNILDEADINAKGNAVETILQFSQEIDEGHEVDILLGRLIGAGIVSMDAVDNQVSRLRGGKWQSLKSISSQIPTDERIRYFKDFLTSRQGYPMLEDLKKELSNLIPSDEEEDKKDKYYFTDADDIKEEASDLSGDVTIDPENPDSFQDQQPEQPSVVAEQNRQRHKRRNRNR